MKKKMNAFIFRGMMALLPVVFWILMVRLLASQQNHGIGFLGFLSAAAFLVFSLQWSIQHLRSKPEDAKPPKPHFTQPQRISLLQLKKYTPKERAESYNL